MEPSEFCRRYPELYADSPIPSTELALHIGREMRDRHARYQFYTGFMAAYEEAWQALASEDRLTPLHPLEWIASSRDFAYREIIREMEEYEWREGLAVGARTMHGSQMISAERPAGDVAVTIENEHRTAATEVTGGVAEQSATVSATDDSRQVWTENIKQFMPIVEEFLRDHLHEHPNKRTKSGTSEKAAVEFLWSQYRWPNPRFGPKQLHNNWRKHKHDMKPKGRKR